MPMLKFLVLLPKWEFKISPFPPYFFYSPISREISVDAPSLAGRQEGRTYLAYCLKTFMLSLTYTHITAWSNVFIKHAYLLDFFLYNKNLLQVTKTFYKL